VPACAGQGGGGLGRPVPACAGPGGGGLGRSGPACAGQGGGAPRHLRLLAQGQDAQRLARGQAEVGDVQQVGARAQQPAARQPRQRRPLHVHRCRRCAASARAPQAAALPARLVERFQPGRHTDAQQGGAAAAARCPPPAAAARLLQHLQRPLTGNPLCSFAWLAWKCTRVVNQRP